MCFCTWSANIAYLNRVRRLGDSVTCNNTVLNHMLYGIFMCTCACLLVYKYVVLLDKVISVIHYQYLYADLVSTWLERFYLS